MSWLKRVWRKVRADEANTARRTDGRESLPHAEWLEARLCLGGLASPDLPDWSNGVPPRPPEASIDVAAEVEVITVGSSRPQWAGTQALRSVEPDYAPAGPSRGAFRPRSFVGSDRSDSLLSSESAQGLDRLDRRPSAGDTDPAVVSTPSVAGLDPARRSAATGTAAAAADLSSAEAPESSPGPERSGTDRPAAGDHELMSAGRLPWWATVQDTVVVRYDFRDIGAYQNVITPEQKDRAADALEAWSEATGGKIVFVQDTTAASSEIVNIGTGDLAAFGHVSGAAGTLGLGGGSVQRAENGSVLVAGTAWLDAAENWDVHVGNGNPEGTFDCFTVVSHEVGHVLGYDDSRSGLQADIMNGVYREERSSDAIGYAAAYGSLYATLQPGGAPAGEIQMRPMVTGFPQLVGSEVEQLLDRGAAASSSNDAIIAIVDRGGNILGVRVEAGALAAIPDEQTLVFAIDGAVAKARTAAFFANNQAPLTSRLVQFISQSTITQREVESNPNVGLDAPGDTRTVGEVYSSTVYGPGFVAPIGIGGHFPPGVPFTPPVDLFAIEHTNRDSLIHAGPDHVKGTPDDLVLPYRFNIDPAFVPAGQEISAPESYGAVSGRLINAQSRGIATLPGGIPLYRDTTGDGLGDTLIGGVGVFFPGPDGFATHEQGFVPGVGQTQQDRVNAERVLEAEYIAYATAGGSAAAVAMGIGGAKIGEINGVAPVPGLDLPFGRLDLVGISLPVYGPIAGRLGLEQLLAKGQALGVGDPESGADQPIALGANGIVDPDPANPIDDVFYADGRVVPEGWLVEPHDSAVDNLSAAEVRGMIERGIQGADCVRAAIRLPLGSRARMVFAVTDTSGEVLGLYRMSDATFFSIDVAVAKARNTAYYADPEALQPFDQVLPEEGVAFTNRTFRFLAEPRFPAGIDGTVPPPFSILNHPGIDPRTGENIGGPAPAGTFDPQVSFDTATVLGFNSFFPHTNFQDPDNIANQNGIVFFPGSTPLYRDGQLIGGLGVSGDGVDQDDVVTFLASKGFFPGDQVRRADETFLRGVRLPYIKFLRNPFG